MALLLQSGSNRIISAYVWQQFFGGRSNLAAAAGVLLCRPHHHPRRADPVCWPRKLSRQ